MYVDPVIHKSLKPEPGLVTWLKFSKVREEVVRQARSNNSYWLENKRFSSLWVQH